MNQLEKILSESPSSVLIWTLMVLCMFFFVKYLWKRRYLYYQSAILPGPFSLPIIGTPKIVLAGQNRLLKNYMQMTEEYPQVFRLWLGPQLHISTRKPSHVVYILTNCLNKENISFYQFIDEIFTSIFSTSLDRWKKHRKNINPVFSQQMMKTYYPIMIKHTNKLLIDLEQNVGETVDLLPVVWSSTLRIILENIASVDTDKHVIDFKKLITLIVGFEKSVVERVVNPMYYMDFMWKLSPEKQKLNPILNKINDVLQGVFNEIHKNVKPEREDMDNIFKINKFFGSMEKGNYTEEQRKAELIIMFIAGSETTAIATCTVLLVMGIYPDIQEKLYQEQQELLREDREVTPDDLPHLNYLDRVIKETLRLSPTAPLILRYIDKTVTIDSQCFPQGSIAFIPLQGVHRNPEVWPDPLKFDPDRFLPEEVEKRPRGAYVPFSHGFRNCIGKKYGVDSMKLALSNIIRKFKVNPVKYTSLAEVERVFLFLAPPKDGFKIKLTRRSKQ